MVVTRTYQPYNVDNAVGMYNSWGFSLGRYNVPTNGTGTQNVFMFVVDSQQQRTIPFSIRSDSAQHK